MLRVIYEKLIKNPPSGNVRYIEGACNSNDTMPVDGICTGSYLHVVDKRVVYAFDEETGTWDVQQVFSDTEPLPIEEGE